MKRIAVEITAPRKLERIRLARGLLEINFSGMIGFATRDSTKRKVGKVVVNAIKEATTNG